MDRYGIILGKKPPATIPIKEMSTESEAYRVIEAGQPCEHPGCSQHFSHPCEVCGRTGMVGAVLLNQGVYIKLATAGVDCPFCCSIIIDPRFGCTKRTQLSEKIIRGTKLWSESQSLVCIRKIGHTGPHVACSIAENEHNLKIWDD